jgi:hypothetical protein
MIKGLLKTIFVLAMLLVATQAFALGEGGGNTTINGCTLNTAYLSNNNMYIRFSANSYCGSIEVFDSQSDTHLARSASNLSNLYYASSEENGVIIVPTDYIAAGNPVTFTIRAHDPQVWSSYSQATVTYGGGLTTSCVLTNFSYDISSPGIPNRVDYDYIHYASPFSCIPVFNGTQYMNSPITSNFVGGVNSLVVWAVPAGLGVGSPGSYVSDYVSFNYPGGGNVGGNAPVVTLTANPTFGTAGVVNPTLTWSVTNAATSCMASGDWAGNKNTNGGSEATGVLNLVKTYTFTLTCANTYGQGSDDATVLVGGSSSADLIASVPSPTGATVNVAQTFTSSITNQGTNSTGSGFTNLFQISQSSDGSSPTDYPTTVMSALAGGASANTSRSITFPSIGAWYIRVCADKSNAADVNGVITEANENNNCSMSTPWTLVTVTTPPNPDLIADAPTPTTATAGVAQTFSSTITNAGSLSTGAGFTNLFQVSASSNGASPTDYPVAGMSALAAGGYATTSRSITLASVGTWYVRACADKSSAADANGVIGEVDENNNCSSPWTAVNVTSQPVPVVNLTANPTTGTVNVVNPTLTWTATNSPTSCTASGDWSGPQAVSGTNVAQGVLGTVKTYTYTLTCSNAYGPGVDDATVVVSGAGGIDLTAGAITPITAPVSTLTTFYSTIQNMGASATGAGFTNLFQTATAADGTGWSDAPGTTNVASSLAGGASVQISKAISFGTTGTKYIRACADKDKNSGVGTIGETNEGNNCGPWTAVTVGLPDLVAAVPTTVGTPQVNTYTSLSSVITNQGAATTGSSFFVRFKVDTNADHSVIEGAFPYGNSSVALAGNGATLSVTSANGNYNFPTAGTYYVQACADENSSGVGAINEGANEGNNCSAWTSFYVGPTGTISGNPCVIASGASNCNSSVTWNTVNPVVTSVVKNSGNTTITTANSGTMNMTVKYPSETFTLFNGSATLASDVIQSSCASGTSWNGTYCEANSGNPGDECANGATNYPECTLINNVCANGATNPPDCTINIDTCINGADNPPICTTVGATCLNGFTNPPSCTAKKPIFKEN